MRARPALRSFHRTATAVALVVSMSLVASTGVDGAPRLHPLAVVPVTLEGVASVGVSAGGGSVVATDAAGQSQHVSVASGVVAVVQDSADARTNVPAGPQFTAGTSGGDTLLKRNLRTGALDSYAVDFPPDEPGRSASGWVVSGGLSVDDSARLLAFDASNMATGEVRGFVFDTERRALLAVAPTGLLTVGMNSTIERIAADGSYVLTREFDVAGSVGDRVVRWNTTSGATHTVDAPALLTSATDSWETSDDLIWTAFSTDRAAVVPGYGGSPGLYRLDNRIDRITVVTLRSSIRSYSAHTGGRVLWIERGNGRTQLFSQDVGSRPKVLSVNADRVEGNGDVVGHSANADATVITFLSLADDLANDARTGEPNVYQVVLPPVVEQGPLEPDEERCFAVEASIPDAGALPGDWVTLNVTPVDAVRGGFGTAHSSDDQAGGTASVNFRSGSIDPNIAFAQVGRDGRVCFTNSEHGPVHVVLDYLAFSSADTFAPPTPGGATRIADTRIGLGGSRLQPREERCVDAAGAQPGEWVSINVAPVEAVRGGFGTLHSSDDRARGTANVNFSAGTIDPNIAFAEVGVDGRVCFTNSEHGPVHLVLDQMTVSPASTFRAPTTEGAVRLVDTRIGLNGSRFQGSVIQCFATQGASPGEWVTLNVTPVDAVGGGYGTVFSSDSGGAPTSSVNFTAGSVDPNVAFVQVGADGNVCFTNSRHGPVDLVVDELAVSPEGTFSHPVQDNSTRLVDTREPLD